MKNQRKDTKNKDQKKRDEMKDKSDKKPKYSKNDP
jgi:hypothetical protein